MKWAESERLLKWRKNVATKSRKPPPMFCARRKPTDVIPFYFGIPRSTGAVRDAPWRCEPLKCPGTRPLTG